MFKLPELNDDYKPNGREKHSPWSSEQRQTITEAWSCKSFTEALLSTVVLPGMTNSPFASTPRSDREFSFGLRQGGIVAAFMALRTRCFCSSKHVPNGPVVQLSFEVGQNLDDI
jgi:hypothetical protein